MPEGLNECFTVENAKALQNKFRHHTISVGQDRNGSGDGRMPHGDFEDMEMRMDGTRKAAEELKAWLKIHLISAMQSHFGHIVQDLISSPGFNSNVNTFCNFVLDEAEDSLPELKMAMYIPGARRNMLKIIKSEVKDVLVLLLIAGGSTHDDAVSFVDTYVSNDI